MKAERTLVLIKPDGLKKSLTGNIITTLSETRLKIVGAKIVKVTKDFAKKHSEENLEGYILKQVFLKM
jgi:nucleoside-diphosphate kinase